MPASFSFAGTWTVYECRLADLPSAPRDIGIEFEEFREPRFAAPTLLKHMVAAGYTGRKSGRGFYDYQSGQQPPRPT